MPTQVKKFIEKPDIVTAQFFVDDKTFLWNAGFFLFRAKDIISALQKLAPEFVNPVKNRLKMGNMTLGFIGLRQMLRTNVLVCLIGYAIM